MSRVPTIRAALLLGFGLTLAVWGLAGYRVAQQVAVAETRAAAISGRYMRAQAVLAALREDALFLTLTLREALLDPDAAGLQARRGQYEAVWQRVADAVGRYEPVTDSTSEREGRARLQREVDQFGTALREALLHADTGWENADRMALRSRIGPSRDGILRVSEEVQALNRRLYVEQRAGVSEAYRSIQRPLWQMLGAALLLTLAIALWSTRHASRLEHRVVEQAARESQIARDLQRLSSQLLSAGEAERRSLARELHDEVGQGLTAIKMEVSLAERAWHAGQSGAAPLDRVRRITEDTLQSVRELSRGLHPSVLDDFGLPAALESYLRGISRRTGLTIDASLDGLSARLAADVEVTVYRIVQEAIANVVKHAETRACQVRLAWQAGILELTVTDQGRGFDDAARRAGPDRGLGLISIRERVAQFDGRFTLQTAPGAGTRLLVSLPARWRGQEDGGGDPAAPAALAAVGAEDPNG